MRWKKKRWKHDNSCEKPDNAGNGGLEKSFTPKITLFNLNSTLKGSWSTLFNTFCTQIPNSPVYWSRNRNNLFLSSCTFCFGNLFPLNYPFCPLRKHILNNNRVKKDYMLPKKTSTLSTVHLYTKVIFFFRRMDKTPFHNVNVKMRKREEISACPVRLAISTGNTGQTLPLEN